MDSLPVPLQIQCLLYLIGNLFDDDDKPIPGLALLPRSIRIKLLLLLPAVDVHKIEGTSVTHDILMDEIWKTLYKERQLRPYHRSYGGLLPIELPILDERTSLFSFKDLYFSTAMLHPCFSFDGHYMFYDANKELSVYFTHVKESVYIDYESVYIDYESVYNYYKIATFHNVIWLQHGGRVTTKGHVTKTFKSKAVALTMIGLHIPLKIVTNNLLQFDHDILIKLTQSAEAIFWGTNYDYLSRRVNSADIEKFFKIIFIENECCINSCICEEYEPLPLLLDYLQQQCDLKILYVKILQKEDAKFQEVVKRHKNLEVVSIHLRGRLICNNNCIVQCLSELMHRPCFQQLNIHVFGPSTSFIGHSLPSAFFLSPYTGWSLP